MKKRMTSLNQKMAEIWFVIFIETLLISKAVIATSLVTISSDANTNTSGIIYNKPAFKLNLMQHYLSFTLV